MGLLQKAVETYDANKNLVGIYQEGTKEPLAPVAHWIGKSNIEIVLDSNGQFKGAEREQAVIIFPVTQNSNNRTSTEAIQNPHPLCDKLSYLGTEYYISGLEKWATSAFSHNTVKCVLEYMRQGTLMEDLARYGIGKSKADLEAVVRWYISGLPVGQEGACWKDKTLFEAFINYYTAQISSDKQNKPIFCMIAGQELPIASHHPKGIITSYGNAKLISSNDSQNFTYRGRFHKAWQAASVSYEASQKAHNALRWLAAEQSVRVVFGGRTFLCWNPQGRKVHPVTMPLISAQKAITKPSDYRKTLLEALEGYRRELPEKAGVVIVTFDVTSKKAGRLSLTYYNELMGSDFLQRLYDWDQTCWWYHRTYGVQTPLLYQIVKCTFGVQRTEKGKTFLKTDDRVMRQQMQRLVACRLNRDTASMSYDIVQALVQRASTPQAYDSGVWREIVYTACAVLQKYIMNREGVTDVSWELDKTDRSFQFGRLLAVMERVERDFYYENTPKNKGSSEDTAKDKDAPQGERQTSALKSMSRFRQHPLSVYAQVNQHLNEAYVPRLKNPWYRERYERLRSEIMDIITSVSDAEDLNMPLDDVYIIGYDLQRAAFFRKKDKPDAFDNDEPADENDENKEEPADEHSAK